MKEIVVISGKGGTGKTSITSSFAAFWENIALADCDVDAADLHLVMTPKIIEKHDFISGGLAKIRQDDCTGCGKCYEICRFESIVKQNDVYYVDETSCEGCGVCVKFCDETAIDFPPRNNGKWFFSETRFGPMIHARLGIAAENSGQLVSLVRREIRKKAQEKKLDIILVDGPPGTGCPAISSITGADAVVVVTEPSMSGIHDMKRIVELTRHFGIKTFVCTNKWDINPENSENIEKFLKENDIIFLGKVPYSKYITKAQIKGKSVVEVYDNEVVKKIKEAWENLCLGLK